MARIPETNPETIPEIRIAEAGPAGIFPCGPATGLAAVAPAVGRGDVPPGADPFALFAIPMVGGSMVAALLFAAWRRLGAVHPATWRLGLPAALMVPLAPGVGQLGIWRGFAAAVAAAAA